MHVFDNFAVGVYSNLQILFHVFFIELQKMAKIL